MPQQTPDFIPSQAQSTPDFIPHQAASSAMPDFIPHSAASNPAPQTAWDSEVSALMHGDFGKAWDIERPKYTGGGLAGMLGAKRDPGLDQQYATPPQQRQAEPAWSPSDPYGQAHPYQRAAHDVAAGFTSPEQIALLMGTGGAGEVGNAANLAFRAQMLQGGVQGGANAYGAYKQGNLPEAKYQGTVAALSGLMGSIPEGHGQPDFIPHDPAKVATASQAAPSGVDALEAALGGTKGEVAPSTGVSGAGTRTGETGAGNRVGSTVSTRSEGTALAPQLPTVGSVTPKPPLDKAAKIESQQVTGPNRAAWEAQNRDYEIARQREIANNPAATPEERQAAASMAKTHQELAQPGAAKALDVARKTGLNYRGEVSPGTGVHDFQAPDGGSLAMREKELSPERAQQKLTQRTQEIKPSELSDVARTKGEKLATSQAPRATEAKAPEPNRSAAQEAQSTPAVETDAQRRIRETQAQIDAIKGGQSTRKPLPKQTPAEIAADRELLAHAQDTSNRETRPAAPDASTITNAQPPSARAGQEPVRAAGEPVSRTEATGGSAAGSKTPLERTEKPQEPRTPTVSASGRSTRQRPLESAPIEKPGDVIKNRGGQMRRSILSDKPLTDKGQKGVFSLGGKPSANQRAANRMSSKIDLTRAELSSKSGADYLRAVESFKGAKGTPKDYEAIYHHTEDPSVPLTAKQSALQASDIDHWTQERDRAYQVNKSRGMPASLDPNHMHRIPIDRDTKLEKVLTQGMKYSSGARLSKSASGLQGRTYYQIETPNGGKAVVHEGRNENISAWVNQKEIKLGDKSDLEAKGYKFTQATTKQIEQHAPQKYYKNALVSTVLDTLEQRRVERATDAIEDLKAHPDFKKVAKLSATAGTLPKGWGKTNVPQFEGYAFEPKTKAALDRYWDEVTKGEPSALEKMNDWLRTSIFFNPLIHTKNIAVHWAVEKGVTGFLPHKWSTIMETGRQATRDVLTQNDNYKYAQDQGAPLQSAKRATREMESLLISKMAQQMHQNPTLGAKVADLMGYKGVKALFNGIYDFSNKVTWTFDDIARLQATYQHMKENPKMDFKASMAEVNKHLPDYRIPTHVLNSKGLSSLLRNKNLTMFSAYHYGALKSYMEMGKDLLSSASTPAERAMAANRLAMLGLITAVLYPTMDYFARKMTGKKDARVDRSGASTFVDNLYLLARGEKAIPAVAQAVMTPSPALGTVLRVAEDQRMNRASRLKPVPIAKQAVAAGKDVLDTVGPIGQSKMLHGNFDPTRFFWGLLGVRYGSDAPDRGNKGSSMSRLPRIKGSM